MNLIDKDALMTTLKISNTKCEECESVDPNYGSCMRDFAEACAAIIDAPTIEEPHWIPCSERLLKEEEEETNFLVTDGESMTVGYYRQDAKVEKMKFIDIDCPNCDCKIHIVPEIIYCQDCKHWIPYDWMFNEIWQSQNINDYSEDEIGCEYCDMKMKVDDFCSKAERRKKNETN